MEMTIAESAVRYIGEPPAVSSSERTDAQWMALLQSDPDRGMERIYAMYAGYVYAIVRSRLKGTAPEEDIEECVSDVFVLFYQQAQRLDPERGSIKSYLMVLAQRTAVSRWRKLVRRTEEIPLDDARYAEECGESPSESFAEKEERALLLDAVLSLGEPDTTILLRKYFLGESIEQIAKALKMSKSSVVKHTRKCLEKLKSIVGGDENGR